MIALSILFFIGSAIFIIFTFTEKQPMYSVLSICLLFLGITILSVYLDGAPPKEYEVFVRDNTQYVIVDGNLINLNRHFGKIFVEDKITLERVNSKYRVVNKVHPEVHEISGDASER